MVSVIIPAYNEENTVGSVVSSVIGHPQVGEVIVVDDGSRDRTAERAQEAGAKVIRLERNKGKALAMDKGVETAQSSTILFLDADVLGFTHEAISSIITPVIEGKYEMFIGILVRRTSFFDRMIRFLPHISGQRALTKSLWAQVPQKYKKGFEIELAMNYVARQTELGMGTTRIGGAHHITKEKKYGLVRGFLVRLKMIRDITVISVQIYFIEHWIGKVTKLVVKKKEFAK